MEKKMRNSLQIAYAEVDKILEYIPRARVSQIPLSIREMIKARKQKDYRGNINIEKPLEEQDLQRKTLVLLAIFHLEYWARSEQREELLKLHWKYEKEKQEMQRRLYDTDEIFEERKEQRNTQTSTAMIVYKENIFQKLWHRLKSLFA